MQTNKTGSWQAQWITASDDMLSGIERFPGGGVPMGKWIWPQAAVRVYMRRDFTVDGPVRTARLRFQCDNEFTLYINGHTVRPRRDGALWDTGVADAAGLLTAGVNHLGVRAFQSADPARFTAALRGGIHIELEDGSERDELTGDDWSAWRHSPGRGVRVRAIRAAARIRARTGALRGTLSLPTGRYPLGVDRAGRRIPLGVLDTRGRAGPRNASIGTDRTLSARRPFAAYSGALIYHYVIRR